MYLIEKKTDASHWELKLLPIEEGSLTQIGGSCISSKMKIYTQIKGMMYFMEEN